MENSGIQWTDHTFNPWEGCAKVSPACLHCYAEGIAHTRFKRVQWGRGKPRRRTSKQYWRNPIRWNENAGKLGIRQRVFCASLADIFDAEAPTEWRADLWQLIELTPHLDWLLLTKRPENIAGMVPWQTYPENVWIGTSVENQEYADIRLPILSQLPAAVRFISAEPLLGEISLDGYDLDWCIVGGESGAGWRPMDLAHVRSLRDQCTTRGIAFHFKQFAGFSPKSLGRELDGREWNEFPTARRLDEPEATAEPVIEIPDGGLALTPISEIEPTNVGWLWQDRIPLGNLTIMAGDGGGSKSAFTCYLAAAVTRGLDLPDSPAGSGAKHNGSVIIFSCEDSVSSTIRRRLDAAGADVRKVLTPTDLGFRLDITKDLPKLEKAIIRLGDCRLIVIDPISAFMGNTNTRSNSAVRSRLMELKVLAEKYDLAFVLISHFAKAASNRPNNRVIDSVAFVNTARSNLVVTPYQEADKCAVFCTKHNLAPESRPLAFKLVKHANGAPYIRWLPNEDVTVSCAEALADTPKPRGPVPVRSNSAKAFLQGRLQNGPVPVDDLVKAGFGRTTLYGARNELGIKTVHIQGRKCWSITERNGTTSGLRIHSETPNGRAKR